MSQFFQSSSGGSLPPSVATSYVTNSGTAVPSSNILNVIGSNGISTSASGNTVTISESNPIFVASVTLTSQQIKALSETPIQLIPAPGSGNVIYVLSGFYKFVYGGTSAFTNASSVNIIYGGIELDDTYYDAASFAPGQLLLSTENAYNGIANATEEVEPIPFSKIENQPVMIFNESGSDITGNPENNNTLVIHVKYYIDTL